MHPGVRPKGPRPRGRSRRHRWATYAMNQRGPGSRVTKAGRTTAGRPQPTASDENRLPISCPRPTPARACRGPLRDRPRVMPVPSLPMAPPARRPSTAGRARSTVAPRSCSNTSPTPPPRLRRSRARQLPPPAASCLRRHRPTTQRGLLEQRGHPRRASSAREGAALAQRGPVVRPTSVPPHARQYDEAAQLARSRLALARFAV